jgi:hypothetical protein
MVDIEPGLKSSRLLPEKKNHERFCFFTGKFTHTERALGLDSSAYKITQKRLSIFFMRHRYTPGF